MSIHKETLDDELYGVLDSSPYSSTITQISAQSFFQEGFELSLDAIIPSIELTGSFTQFKSKTQLYIYDYSKTIIYSDKNYEGKGSYLYSPTGTSTTTQTSSIYNQFELNPTEDISNQGYSDGRFFAVYNFIDYELGSDDKSSTEPFQDNLGVTNPPLIITNPYFIKDISGDRTELRIQNNFLTSQQIETYYNNFKNKLDARENVDEFYISFDDNENFIGINIQLELALPNSSTPTSILIKLYKPLPAKFKVDQKIQIITKVGETQVFEVEFKPNLVFIDDLFSLKGPNYNISIKDKVNNSTNFKNLKDLINTNSSESYYQFNSLQDQKGIIIRKNWGDWNEFVKYSLAEQRLRNFRDKMGLIESSSAEIASLQTITGPTTTTIDYSASINDASNNINTIIKKFDSYEYFLYYITGSESWPKYTSTYPYTNYSVTSSEANNWFGDTNEQGIYFNTGKNQIYLASRYDNDNQDNLYYLIPSFITQNISNEQYIKFVSMVGQTFDEIYLYTEAVEQIRNTNSNLTGSVLPLGMADDVIESLGFDTSGNDFSPIGFNINGVGTFPPANSGLEYITRYIDIASGSVINYYDQQQSTLGYVIALSDPSFPYPLENTSQEIYRRIFHNMISLVKRKGTVTGLRQLINIWGVPNTMLRISEFGGKNKNDENDYDEWMNRYSTAFNSYPTPFTASNTIDTSYFGQVNATAMFPWLPLAGNYKETAATPDVAVPDCIQFRFKTARHVDGTTNISESLLLKRGQNGGTTANIWAANGDFGIYLHQSGSQSGSYSGSIDPFDNNFASMSFVISGSLTQGATSYASGQAHCYVTSPIYLPFYNKEWWTVQLQRKTHLSASNQDATLNEFELRVGQNIYEGYDGNQIGWVASSSLTMSNAVTSQSMNESWNRMYRDTSFGNFSSLHNYNDSQVYLPGNILKHPTFQQSNTVGKQASYLIPGFDLGVPMSGSFQEFRYYRRALSASAFNDFVMNPKSIQGHGNRNYGPGSSYDLVSYRVPLGNELEFTEPNGTASYIDATAWADDIRQFSFGKLVPTNANGGNFTGQSIGSMHPSAINYDASRILYTGSFCAGAGFSPTFTTDPYFLAFRFAANPNLYITSSYITANNEIIYMDQPSAGIRNRISNKIQVIDKNEYGTTLSPFRSIQQEYEQSGSYTEDINSLEVGFSFQNEINDDIIATFGHGVVSDAIADPRFTSESSDRYPELTRIAEDYFKKYQGFTINSPSYSSSHSPSQVEREYDYKRLIKFYETSLFRAIKNYIPARTSLSTGIIVKQHLLERNRAISMLGITTETPIAKTPETGSNSSGYTTQTGFNSVISNKNLEITSSIGTYSLTGSAGGSVNKYNIPTSSIGEFTQSWTYLDDFTGDILSHSIQDEFYNGEFSGSEIATIPPQYNPYNKKNANYLDPQYFYPNDAFTILPTQSLLFQNSPYNPLINNVSGSRKNSFLFDQDFDPTPPGNYLKEGIPNDYALTVSASQLGFGGANSTNVNLLEYSEIPDSNYTAKAIITPRYEGSKMISADYNFGLSLRVLSASISSTEESPLMRPGLYNKYTGERKIQFLDGSIGSWGGDSTGKYPSAVDSRPIYFAHFKSSYENLEKYNTSTFNIDQLIQVPFESIQGEQAPIITSSQLTGNNKNLLSVGSTFTPNRKVKAIYNQASKQFRNLKKFTTPSSFTTISPILDYTTMDGSSNYITFPAQEIISYYTNEKTPQTVVLTHSFNAPIWISESINYTNPVGNSKPIWRIMNTRNNNSLGSVTALLTASIQPLPVNTFSASTSLLVTGSSPMGDSLGYGLLYLQGMSINPENLYQYNFVSDQAPRNYNVSAPHLQLINTINTNIDIGDISYSTSQNPYLFPDGTINSMITNSCAQWSPQEIGNFGTFPFTVSTFVKDPVGSIGLRQGGGLPSFSTNPLKSIARKGIQNYFTYNYSMSALTEYPQKSLPIMIERGDVIRVTYAYPLLTITESANTLKTNEIVTQDFQVLGYEQAPPALQFSKPTTYTGTTPYLGWGSNNTQTPPDNHFQALAQNLPPTGMFSPDNLKERFDLLATNGQKVIGVAKAGSGNWADMFSGSIIDCVVETRWGELSGSSTTVATTGSIKVTFAGEKSIVGSAANHPVFIFTVQEVLRTTMGGKTGTYQEPLGNTVPSSLGMFTVEDSSTYNPTDPGFIFDTLKVTPDPSKLQKPIPNGSIMAATFIKRQDNDTKVIVDITQPPESIGALTPSGDGYLIPDDLTEIQKDNVQKIINVLKSQNSFTNPPDANATNDVG